MKSLKYSLSYLKISQILQCRKFSSKSKWQSVIGLEIHAQIAAQSKLFSRAGTNFGAPVNTQVSLLDCGIPGTLPCLNRRCVEAAVLTGLALNCKINLTSEFDRKHYFYADIPTGYQITQQRKPIAQDGYIEFLDGKIEKKKVHIKQIQLEQDSGKSLHDSANERSLIDLNRAGMGLMEIVFEPELHSAEEAANMVNDLILVLKKLKTCDCKMDEGSLRVDANISVHRPDEPLGVRTEIKNLNSVRAMVKAIEFEIQRQIQVLREGGKVVNETRGFDPSSNQTVPMRDKEAKQDYRFMPEPNLTPLRLDDDPDMISDRVNVAHLRSQIPKMPDKIRSEIMNQYNVDLQIANQLIRNESLFDYFARTISNRSIPGKKVYHAIVTDLSAKLFERGLEFDPSYIKPEDLGMMVELLFKKKISNFVYEELIGLYLDGEQKNPTEVVEEKGWFVIDDSEELKKLCQTAMDQLPKAVSDYRRGKKRAINALAGQVKKISGGMADMNLVTRILKDLL
ncbi:glutamyl-tRNA(Gln) amidotransferase subunit B, mitochondrial-like isoform X2 [Artemia franciscana]|uniref:Glutamyl-tRNA(Gln) amidotransferase subunit B, mitochondrial n=1 Tax=Artemia franciscana TaxID=6661 RepID=A0AA88HZQ5_ARTSF|nr:hypothetical protein QYM36_010108 [Artemia franciscana]